jgi:hypothetical protein
MILNDLKRFSTKNKRFAFIVCGNSNLAKSIVVNHLLQRRLIPVDFDVNAQQWRIVKIRVSSVASKPCLSTVNPRDSFQVRQSVEHHFTTARHRLRADERSAHN